LESQIGDNVEVYVTDVVVKTIVEDHVWFEYRWMAAFWCDE
jgi:hypothetical protein